MLLGTYVWPGAEEAVLRPMYNVCYTQFRIAEAAGALYVRSLRTKGDSIMIRRPRSHTPYSTASCIVLQVICSLHSTRCAQALITARGASRTWHASRPVTGHAPMYVQHWYVDACCTRTVHDITAKDEEVTHKCTRNGEMSSFSSDHMWEPTL